MYYKQISNGYIVSIGVSESVSAALNEITESEYQQIIDTLADRPTASDGYGYKLKTDLLWEQYTLPPAPAVMSEETLLGMSNAELESILASYGITASMNKQNMVRLILDAQGEGGAGD